MKFLIVGDLHGQKPHIHFEEYDAIIAPGDFCSSDEIRKYSFQALRERHRSNSKTKWYDLISKKKARDLAKKSLEDGREILKFLNSFNVPVYVVPGNADFTPAKEKEWVFLQQNHYKELIEGLENIFDVHHRLVDMGEYQTIGHGISSGPEYPQYKEDLERLKSRELKEQKAEYEKDSKKLTSLFERASKPVVFLSHNVPFDTPLDRITNKESPRYGYHYGSLIAKEMIEKHQPLVCIGGHMHEHFGKCKIGRTVCINAGFGSLVNTLMELENGRITRLQFHKATN